MSVISVDKDVEALTMTVVAEFDAPVERLWQVWQDPRQLERWWGPPGYPATFVEHDLTPDGRVTYFMTDPEGERYHGWWRVISIDPPHRLEFEDGFADGDGRPSQDMPQTIARVTLDPVPGGTRMAIATSFPSAEAMQQLVEMGMEEGITAALGQIDDILSL